MRNTVLVIAAAFALTGCSQSIDFRNGEVSNGMIFANGDDSPFSGLVTNIPLTKMPMPDIGPLVAQVSEAGGENNTRGIFLGAGLSGVMGGRDVVLCDAEVEDGYLSGDAVCKVGKATFMEIAFEEGTAQGDFVVFDPAEEVRVVEGRLENGKLAGEARGYSAATGKLIQESRWVNGRTEGPIRVYHSDTGNLVVQYTLIGGVRNGEFVRYAPNGESLLLRAAYLDGRLHGGYEEFDAEGNIVKRTIEDQGSDMIENWSGYTTPESLMENEAEGSVAVAQVECVKRARRHYRDQTHGQIGPTQPQVTEWVHGCLNDAAYTLPEGKFSLPAPAAIPNMELSDADRFVSAPDSAEASQQAADSAIQAAEAEADAFSSTPIDTSLSAPPAVPSFDCRKAASPAELMICGDAKIADADVRLMATYKSTMACATDKAALRSSQRAWLSIRDGCDSNSCMLDAYVERIAVLERTCSG